MKGRLWVCALILLAALLAGCSGSRVTGKFSNQDKPKPVADSK